MGKGRHPASPALGAPGAKAGAAPALCVATQPAAAAAPLPQACVFAGKVVAAASTALLIYEIVAKFTLVCGTFSPDSTGLGVGCVC